MNVTYLYEVNYRDYIYISYILFFFLFQVNFVCQFLRGSRRAMGGIQVILLGDFRQLPPVPSKWSNDPGKWAFESKSWVYIAPHVIELCDVQRQQDKLFIQCIRDVARGYLSDDSMTLLSGLNSGKERSTHLFSKRIDVDLHNAEQLKCMDGDVHYFDSREGKGVPKKLRNSLHIPVILGVKVNAPVILTVNISNKLVNGLNGYVKSVSINAVYVYFPCIKETHEIKYYDYFRYCEKAGRDIFICSQIPLILGFGMTIHRAQGMTLSNVALHCEGAFECGQIGVGLSRVKKTDDITVLNFRKGLCPPHGPALQKFYFEATQGNIVDDLTCCTLVCPLHECDKSNSNDEKQDEEEGQVEEEEDNDEIDEYVAKVCDGDINVLHSQCDSMPDSVSPGFLRKKMTYETPHSDTQRSINDIMSDCSDDDLKKWTGLQVCELRKIINDCGTANTKQCNQVVKRFLHDYPQSETFINGQKALFRISQVQQVHQIVCVNGLIRIQHAVFQSLSEREETHPKPTPPYPTPNPSSKSKIRYVGGMCVGKLMFPTTQYLIRHCYNNSELWQQKRDLVKVLQNHVYPSLLIASKESAYPESLSEISHKKRTYGNLTVVDDSLFLMFMKYDEILYPLLCVSNLTDYKLDFFKRVLDVSVKELYACGDLTIPDDVSVHVFTLLAVRYVKVTMKEMKVKLLAEEKVKKCVAHRKHILMDKSLVEPPTKKPCKSSTTDPAPQQCSSNDVEREGKDQCMCSGCGVSLASNKKLQRIQCNVCQRWRHRKCDCSLRSHKLWKKLQQPNEPYVCPLCTQSV